MRNTPNWVSGIGAFSEAVEAGLALIKRQAAYQEILKLKGKIEWGWPGDERLQARPNWFRVDAQGREIPEPVTDTAPVAKKAGRGRR